MAQPSSLEDRIRREFDQARKEYTAYDRTLDALASLSFILQSVKEIKDETLLSNFRPKLEPTDPDDDPYTPEGLICQKPSNDFVLELKTSWNEHDIPQVIKYGRSSRYFALDGTLRPFAKLRCILLGYQNIPGEENLDKLFDAWDAGNFHFPLVVFRYSLEQGSEGDRMFFSRAPYSRNGKCPNTNLGRAFNSVRGYPVSVDRYRSHRARFHKASDQIIPSYAAVLWWTTYARYYLSEEQKIEMAERGRLSSPLIIPIAKLDQVPTPADVEVPLGPRDVRRALEFLAEAGLVGLKKRDKVFEVVLKEDRHIRVPQAITTPGHVAETDISVKILARWAVRKAKAPPRKVVSRKRRARPAKHPDNKTLPLPFPGGQS